MAEPASESEAEVAKRLGNEAFSSKSFDLAITHYSEAIRLEPGNAIYYSNRSACYASKSDWAKSLEDAAVCVSKDPKFIKGYYRLATAQSEMGAFSDAEVTINAALQIEPANEQLLKLKKALRTKKTAAAKAKKGPRQLDEAQMKELMELQEQTNSYSKDLRAVQNRIQYLQRDFRASQVTSQHVTSLPAEVPLYRALGKAFVLAPRTDIERGIEVDLEKNTRNQRELMDRKEFLERRVSSNMQNMRELTAGV